MTSIYILEKNGIPFYVGKARDVTRRKHKHYITFGDDISLEIIDICDDEKEVWKFWERHYISLFKSWGFKLENKNNGGGGPTQYSEIFKQKMRKPHKEGTGDKISKTLKERNHSKYYTEEVRQKMSISQKGIAKPFTEKHIENIKISRRAVSKKVLMYDLQDNLIKEWESKGQAAEWIKEQTGKTSNITSQIKDCILGRQKTAFKYKWKYK